MYSIPVVGTMLIVMDPQQSPTVRTLAFVGTILALVPLVGEVEGVAVGAFSASQADAVAAGSVAAAEEATVTGANVISRVQSLRAAIPAAQSGRITMAVGLVEDANGVESTLISTSEPGGYLRPGVTLQPGEVLVPGTGHAEMDIANYARENGLFLKQLGATRPVCPGCALEIPWGTLVVTPLKVGGF